MTRVPQTTPELGARAGHQILRCLEDHEGNDDIHNVTANFNIPDAIMQEVLKS